jgi:hypothetical protein
VSKPRTFLEWLPAAVLWALVGLFGAAVLFSCVWFGLYEVGWRDL